MSLRDYGADEGDTFTNDSDPILKKVERKAGASVVQDLMLGTYWANTVGRTKYPGVYQMHKKELEENLSGLLKDNKMSYRQIEEFLGVIGYDSNDIRCAFEKLTGMDPVKLEFMRQEDLKSTPGNIPGYNCGWGPSKKGGVESYFVMPTQYGFYTVFAQKSDTEREEVKSFLRHDEAIKHLTSLVKDVHRYDLPVLDAVDEAPELDMDEPTSRYYRAVADRFYDLERKGALTSEYIIKTVRDTVTCGNLTEVEGYYLIKKYAGPEVAETVPVTPAHAEETGPSKDQEGASLKDVQENTSVVKEMKKRTPQDFFKATLPNRIEEIATEHIQDVLSYIANRESDIENFGVKLHSLQYQKNDEAMTNVGQVNPQTGELVGPPRATISAILEIENKTMASENNRKFVLAVFFVNANGQIATSDSVKGEDDIIYGFTQEGLEQYFSKNTKQEKI